ncbi:MAG: Jag N-terminal domain-containing protein [Candidatus Dadabacteria bacterium]|nr:Jag N-terminal domain-containing protein [Candidatus Dadabacteria bacterium]
MRETEKEAPSIEEAIEEALIELGVQREEVEVEVLREPSRGILGIGGRKAKVSVRLRRGGGGGGRPGEGRDTGGPPIHSEKVPAEAEEAVKGILDIMGIAHKVKVSETDSAVEVDLKVEESQGLLIGKYGETLRSLEYVVARIVSAKTGKQPNRGKRISIDINGYKREREKELERKATEAARKVIESGRPFTFHRMQAYERKVVYTAVKDMEGIKFETKEDGNAKKITFLPDAK